MGFSPDHLLSALEGFPPVEGYWIAYSGGLDSSVLLHAMAALRGRLRAPLWALHLDHGLQDESAHWSAHCARQCGQLNIPLTHQRLSLAPRPGSSVEAEAREARLAAFRQTLRPGQMMLTAQHRDDQAETLLLQLLRGSGLSGLAAMPELAELGPGWLGRPLLRVGRADLRAYARAESVRWIEDPSNAGLRFDRNYLRHEVLPLIAARWPSYAETFSRSARHCAQGQGLIDALAEQSHAAVQGRRPGSLSVSRLRALEPALCRALLRHWIRRQGFRLPDTRHLDRILREVLGAAPDRSPLVAWQGSEVRRYRDDLFILAPLPPRPAAMTIVWEGPQPLRLAGTLGYLQRSGVDGALEVRFGVGGQRCRIAGKGHGKSLKKLYQEYAVPDWIRPYVPLVFAAGRLLSIGGLCTCDAGAGCIQWRGHAFGRFLGDSLAAAPEAR